MQFGYSANPEEDLAKAYESAKKSVEVDKAFGWAHTALGTAHLMRREHDLAIAEARAAIRVQPGDADAHSYLGFYLHWAGRGEEAIESVRTAMRLNPQFSHSGRFQVFMGFAQTGFPVSYGSSSRVPPRSPRAFQGMANELRIRRGCR